MNSYKSVTKVSKTGIERLHYLSDMGLDKLSVYDKQILEIVIDEFLQDRHFQEALESQDVLESQEVVSNVIH